MPVAPIVGPADVANRCKQSSRGLQRVFDSADPLSMTQLANRTISILIATASILVTTGCANDAGNGALIGGGVGALAGGIIGHQSGHAAGGAIIGGLVGAGTGALIGHASDEHKIDEQKQYDKGYYDAQRETGRDNRQSSYAPAPRSGYYSSSETTRSGIGSGGYSSSRTSTVTTSETYGR